MQLGCNGCTLTSKPKEALMLQDIAPYSYCNDFAWIDPEPTDRVLVYRGSAVLATIENGPQNELQELKQGILRFPTYDMLRENGVVGPHVKPCHIRADGKRVDYALLFTVGDTAYFRCEVDDDALDAFIESESLNDGVAGEGEAWRFIPISQLNRFSPKHRAFAWLVGYEYDTWYRTRRYCGKCGTELVHDMMERMVRCPKCGTMEFPKLFPAVIVGIVDTDRDKILVSRYANREYKRYALIAGFCEMGETVEETVHREVMEEVGLKVKNLRYYKSQPWPPSSSLLFGFFCELDGSNQIKLDEHELECAEWIDRDQLPVDEDYSLTRDMMQVLRDRREGDA